MYSVGIETAIITPILLMHHGMRCARERRLSRLVAFFVVSSREEVAAVWVFYIRGCTELTRYSMVFVNHASATY